MYSDVKHCVVVIASISLKVASSQRVGFSEVIPDYRPENGNLISQYYDYSAIFCFLKCINIFSCLRFSASTSNICYLYMSAYELPSEQNSSILVPEQRLFGLKFEKGLFCDHFAGLSTVVADKNCLLGSKICERKWTHCTHSF